MFSVASSMVVVETLKIFHESMVYFNVLNTQEYSASSHGFSDDTLKLVFNILRFSTFAIANILADFMLIHRCHLLWNSKRMSFSLAAGCFLVSVFFVTGTIMLALGHSGQDIERAHNLVAKGNILTFGAMIASGFLNVILTCLTAGRIWWITIRPMKSLGFKSTYAKRYRSALGIMFVLIFPEPSLTDNGGTETGPIDGFPLLILSAGIAPTLIIVRARLGISFMSSVEDIPSYSQMSFRVPERGTAHSGARADEA
ncbi:hypothetical protein PQX77_001836 [Marasmius sp. AFHP31]|nr:hypothetical protein PQX77_001836 [Marasmius sp. AFHP31]